MMFDENQIRITKGLDFEFDLNQFQSKYVYFDEKNSYIVSQCDVIYGFYNVKKIENDNLVLIEYALLKMFRGNHFGQTFLNKIIDIVSKENKNIEKIVLMIRYDNIISKKIAEKEEFKIDINLMEQLEDEITNFIPYSKNNKYYENKKLCLHK